jgi:hypothetical protein
MNLYQCRVALRPRGPLEVFDLTIRFVRERPGPFVRLALLVIMPSVFVFVPLAWLFSGHWALLLIPMVVGPVAQAPSVVLAGRLLFQDELGAWDAIRITLSRLPAMCLAWTVSLTGFIVSSLTCFVALLPMQGALLYLGETTLLERVGPGRAISRSMRLAGGDGAAAVAGVVSKWALLGWGAVVGEYAGQSLVGFVFQMGQPFGDLMSGVVTPYLLVGMMVGQLMHGVYRLFLYIDARTRLEGWDIQVGMLAVGGR